MFDVCARLSIKERENIYIFFHHSVLCALILVVHSNFQSIVCWETDASHIENQRRQMRWLTRAQYTKFIIYVRIWKTDGGGRPRQYISDIS